MKFAKFVQFDVVYIGELCGLNELSVLIIIRIIGLIRRLSFADELRGLNESFLTNKKFAKSAQFAVITTNLCRLRYHFRVQGILLCSNDFLPKLINRPKSIPLAFR